MTTRPLGTALVLLLSFTTQLPSKAANLEWAGPELFRESVTRHLQLSREQIELETGELFEDDGPASGHSYKQPENREQLSAQVWLKKQLVIPHPQARAAYLVVLSEAPFEALINGTPLKLGANLSGRSLHRVYEFDPQLLRPGVNEIILRGSGKVWIARDDEFALGSRTRTRHPNRSAKSTDAGKTWDYEHLGPEGKLDGEYGVRIFLQHYRPQGSLTTPVLDAGDLEQKAVSAPIRRLGPIRISALSQAGSAGEVRLRARTGDTYVPTAAHWSDWQALEGTEGELERPRGRYVQIEANLASSDPLVSPSLKSLTVDCTPSCAPDWTKRIRVVAEHNEQIIRTSIPFEYEPLDHPRLKRLRQEYRLDAVVKGATNEMELLLRLAQWACNAWDWPKHIEDLYPPWDALEILKPYRDGKPTGGFCQQFNLVFLQACESFGFPGRAISISQGRCQAQHPGGGHEIVELWSNQWKKWVYVDGALSWYIVDPASGTPLSIWELRQRQLPTLRGEPVQPVEVVEAERTRNKQFLWNGLAAPKPLNWYLELRMIPRSNFLQQKAPLPLNQGTDEWSWTGSYVWSDAEVPAGFLFGNRVTKHGDFEWTLNQAHYCLEPSARAGVVRVHLDTETPGFETFLATIDGHEATRVPAVFSWILHPGRNSLRVWPRNIAGRDGIPSWLTLDFNG